MTMSGQVLVDRMEAVWKSIADLGETLTEEQWRLTTDCPGWSVQDQLSHLVGSECGILGRPAPQHTPPDFSYVNNEIGRNNEVVVDWRRPRDGAAVLAEFREVTTERLGQLRKMTENDFAAPADTPIGPGTAADHLRIRIFDAWVHEQDMRRAVNRPGDLEGAVADHSISRVAMAMPYVVGRKVQPSEGTTVVFEVTGSAGRVLPIRMEGTRGNLTDTVPESPDVRLTMDAETFACLSCGRWEPAQAINAGKVQIQGDRTLGETVVQQMNIMI
jgi:uncharacterized protein (TIGR03083 family)